MAELRVPVRSFKSFLLLFLSIADEITIVLLCFKTTRYQGQFHTDKALCTFVLCVLSNRNNPFPVVRESKMGAPRESGKLKIDSRLITVIQLWETEA